MSDYVASEHDHDCEALTTTHRALYPDGCEYDPHHKRAAFTCELHAAATVIVGANGKWRLCASCAALPEFKRFRKRRPVRRTTPCQRNIEEHDPLWHCSQLDGHAGRCDFETPKEYGQRSDAA